MKKSALLSDELKQRLAIDALATTAGGGLGYLQSYLSGSPSPAWSTLVGALAGLGTGEAGQFFMNAPRYPHPSSLRNRFWTAKYDQQRGLPPFPPISQ